MTLCVSQVDHRDTPRSADAPVLSSMQRSEHAVMETDHSKCSRSVDRRVDQTLELQSVQEDTV
jgi:hypothetical protein